MPLQMNLFSLKMRASKKVGNIDHHISGAEKIVHLENAASDAKILIERALKHDKGQPDFINLKVEAVRPEEIIYIEALPVSTIKTQTPQEGQQAIFSLLEKIGIKNSDKILALFKKTYAMRGAMLLDVDTLERLEPNQNRGIRATYMDSEDDCSQNCKNHFKEALVLASKVVSAPHIIGEICMSDDPDYVTGYVAAPQIGYVRITTLKPLHCPDGGRIFLYRGPHKDKEHCIDYLEKQKVLVRHVPGLPQTSCKNPLAEIETALQKLKDEHLYRKCTPISSAQNALVESKGQEMILLASNNYLGLADDKRLKEAASKAIEKFGTGTGGSRLVTGNLILHETLEKELAHFKDMPSALLFNTGYTANLGTISALCGQEDVIFSDELNHASIIDGCRLSRAQTIVYRHNDMRDLEEKIRQTSFNKGLIVSDAVFSMDGDIADLPGIVRLAKKYGLFSMLDEAHALGVIGKKGRGITEYFNGSHKPDIYMGTLSKALGSEGGFVCASTILIDYLRNKARSFIFSTSMAPASAAAALCALDILEKEPSLVRQLQDNTTYFCHCLEQLSIKVRTPSAIVPIMLYDEKFALKADTYLKENGLFISAIRYPTVRRSSARLRAAIMATHTKDDLKKAACLIANAIK